MVAGVCWASLVVAESRVVGCGLPDAGVGWLSGKRQGDAGSLSSCKQEGLDPTTWKQAINTCGQVALAVMEAPV